LGYKVVEFSVSRSESFIAIAPIDFCDDFIIDLGNGVNFYTINEYDDNGDILVSLSECYIRDETDLKECRNEYFNNGSDHINIIDNNETYYLIKDYETFKRFNKIIEEHYSFELISN